MKGTLSLHILVTVSTQPLYAHLTTPIRILHYISPYSRQSSIRNLPYNFGLTFIWIPIYNTWCRKSLFVSFFPTLVRILVVLTHNLSRVRRPSPGTPTPTFVPLVNSVFTTGSFFWPVTLSFQPSPSTCVLSGRLSWVFKLKPQDNLMRLSTISLYIDLPSFVLVQNVFSPLCTYSKSTFDTFSTERDKLLYVERLRPETSVLCTKR